MKRIAVMIKPASSLCNMRCRYCFYGDEANVRETPSFGVMREETANAVLENLFCDLDAGDALSICFQGGEPTLAGLPFFEAFTERARTLANGRVSLSFQIQTNGLLLDDKWCAFLRRERFLVGLSLDGPKEYHDRNRIDAAEKGTYLRVVEAKERLTAHGVDWNALAVLTDALARHPAKLWSFLLTQGISYLQLIPCLGPLDEAAAETTLTAARYARFYAELYDLWERAFLEGKYVSIKLFDDFLNLLSRGEVNACGLLGSCQRQFVIEADGGVYPCDFYCLDSYRVGSFADSPLLELYEAEGMRAFAAENRRPASCMDCPYERICGGGCRRMRQGVYADKNGVCGHRMLLERIYPRLVRLAGMLRARDRQR